MTKEEINKRIFELKSDEEIVNFVKERLNELENNSEEKTVGQNYTDSFQDYISQKIHYKAVDKFANDECPDLVYDDITPYVNLIKEIKKDSWYNTLTLFTTIFFVVHKYLPNNGIGLGRYFTYVSHIGQKLSIKTISDNEIAFCSEKAGMAHNLFKFLGIDSELVCGASEGEMHSYNFIYPKGYGNEPIALFDPSIFVDFLNGDSKISFGFYKAFNKADFETLKSGTPMQIDLAKTEETYRKLYGFNGCLDDYVFDSKMPTYVYGLENAKNYINSNSNLRK